MMTPLQQDQLRRAAEKAMQDYLYSSDDMSVHHMEQGTSHCHTKMSKLHTYKTVRTVRGHLCCAHATATIQGTEIMAHCTIQLWSKANPAKGYYYSWRILEAK